jgi:uncharacterized protein involved in outer membrane biogenesis
MPKSSKLILFALGGLTGLVVLGVVVAALRLRLYARPRLESVASEAMGMEFSVGGGLAIHFLPSLHVEVADVRVRNRGTDVASGRELDLGLALLPLLHRDIRIETIALSGVRISIVKDHDGTTNVTRPPRARGMFPALNLARLSISGAVVLYTDRQSGKGLEGRDCNLNVNHLRFSSGDNSDPLKNLAFAATLVCGEIQTTDLAMSDVSVSVEGKDGLFDFEPINLRLFGGNGSGNVHADFSGPVPVYHVHGSLAKFRIEEFFKALSPKAIGEGAMDFSINLSMQGKTWDDMKRTVAGDGSLRGDNLKFNVSDLDQQLSRYESSQSFNLVDVGAFFFAGPLGLVVTKGYNFASVFRGSRSSSTLIRMLVSEWKIERGVAQAQDAAMATAENRIALKGTLDFVDERFDDVTVAVIDAGGCPTVQQKIRGPFLKPVVEKPNVLTGLTGSTRKLLKQVKGLFGGQCAVFYAGSVAPPK